MSEKTKDSLIIGSGIKLFRDFWVKRVSIDMIVEKAGVAKGTFYLYFSSKEELYKKIIDAEFTHAKNVMKLLHKNFPDTKERLMNFLVGSIIYFKKNDIIRNMVLWNQDYYIGDMNIDYLSKKHEAMLQILLEGSPEITWKKEDLEFFAELNGAFKQVLLLEESYFQTKEDFDIFVLNYARVLVEGFFSDYKEIGINFDQQRIEKLI